MRQNRFDFMKPPRPTFNPDAERESRFNPAAFFAHRDRLARLSVAGLIVCSVVSLISLFLVLRFSTQAPVVLGVDRSGIPFGERGTSFAEAKGLHVEQALLATTALLSRSVGGFDLPEILQVLFSPSALEMAQALQARESTEFQDKNVSQKPHIARVEALETRPDLVLVAVSGKLSRNGVFRQQPFVEVVAFSLHLSLKLNPDILRNRRHPTIVAEFTLTYE